MNRLMGKLGRLDPEVKRVLDAQDIRPQYFSFRYKYMLFDSEKLSVELSSKLIVFARWLTLMLSQEFPLPEVLRIWDSLLADQTRSHFLIDVCAAMIILVR